MIQEEEKVLKEFIEKEDKSAIYSYEIDGIVLYPLIRKEVRISYLKNNGYNQMDIKLGINYKAAFTTSLISLLQFLKLFISRKNVKKIIHCFPRIERVGDYYIDKFTEPVCRLSKLADNSLLFCKSFGGKRREPRLSSTRVIYIDIIIFLQSLGGAWKIKNLNNSEKYKLENFFKEIGNICEDENLNNSNLRKILFQMFCSVKIFSAIYKFLGVEKVYLLPRIPSYIYAAHQIGAKVYEFQHGITYGLSKLYSGKCLPEYTPDFFLAFGNTGPRDVYGIDEKKIITIGWAFDEFIKEEKILEGITEKDVLIISDPEITDTLLNIIIVFAENRKDIQFYFRPHPNQKLTTEQLQLICKYPNIHLQDNKLNSNVVLSCFTHIIGENSTVLYEAVSKGKKVGKLFFPGLNSMYLNESDKSSFYEIGTISDFDFFLNAQNKENNSFSIYTPYNKKYSYIFE